MTPLLTAAKTGLWQNSVMVALESGPRSRDHRLNVRHVTERAKLSPSAGHTGFVPHAPCQPLQHTPPPFTTTLSCTPLSKVLAPSLCSCLFPTPPNLEPISLHHPILSILPPGLCDKHLLALGRLTSKEPYLNSKAPRCPGHLSILR